MVTLSREEVLLLLACAVRGGAALPHTSAPGTSGAALSAASVDDLSSPAAGGSGGGSGTDAGALAILSPAARRRSALAQVVVFAPGDVGHGGMGTDAGVDGPHAVNPDEAAAVAALVEEAARPQAQVPRWRRRLRRSTSSRQLAQASAAPPPPPPPAPASAESVLAAWQAATAEAATLLTDAACAGLEDLGLKVRVGRVWCVCGLKWCRCTALVPAS